MDADQDKMARTQQSNPSTLDPFHDFFSSICVHLRSSAVQIPKCSCPPTPSFSAKAEDLAIEHQELIIQKWHEYFD
jgi:hypothetical protein